LGGFLAEGLDEGQDWETVCMRDRLARFDHREDIQPQVPTRQCCDCAIMRPIGCGLEDACKLNRAPEESLELWQSDEKA
jgi:hypothetical protein